MLRVGYPATIPAELFAGFPKEVELIPLSDKLDHESISTSGFPIPIRRGPCASCRICAACAWCLSLMAGTEWIPGAMGPHVTICNARGAHNISTAEWTLSAILAMLKYFPLYLDMQRSGEWKRRFEATAHYAQHHRRHAAASIRPSCSKNSPARECCWSATAPSARRSSACSRHSLSSSCALPARAHRAQGPCRQRTRQTSSRSRDRDSDPALHGGIASSDRCAPARSDAQGRTAGQRRARADRRHRCTGRCAQLRP